MDTTAIQPIRGEDMKKAQTKVKLLRVRLSEREESKLRAYAERHGRSVSLVIREYIRRLPTNANATSE